MPKKIQFKKIDTKGIHPDRKEIFDIVECLFDKEAGMTYGRIIRKIKYKPLESTMTLSRIVRCDVNRYGDEVEGIKFSELLEVLREKYAPELQKWKEEDSQQKDYERDYAISSAHTNYYIYYYESFDEKENKYYAKFALIGFDFDLNTKEWENGKIYYFTDNIISKIFELKRVRPLEKNPDVLFFAARYQRQVNFFTIKINARPIRLRNMIPLTYSVIETQFSYPCAGKGILEKIREINYKDKIEELIDDKRGIADEIVNFLYLKKYVLVEPVHEKPAELLNNQMPLLKGFMGLWAGVYLRVDYQEKRRSSSAERGGLCKFMLHIKRSGKCELYYEQPDKISNHCYSGFVEFPFNDKSIMKISLEYSREEKTYRINILTSAASSGTNETTYAGVISGWANINKDIYSSTIYMEHTKTSEKPLTSEEILDGLATIDPHRFTKNIIGASLRNGTDYFEVLERLKINPEHIDALQDLENKYMSTFKNCMPENI